MKLLPLAAPALISILAPQRAEACGGFFCGTQPVLQTAERIIFVLDEDKTTAFIQLQYAGNDPSFAWIVPVPAVPEVEVNVGQAMFDTLDAQTQPIFMGGDLSADAGALAAQDAGAIGCGFGSGGVIAPSLSARYVPPPEVNIYASARVGPYDYVTLDARDARDLNDWLGINGYRPVPGSEPIVQEYLDQGMKLLALKLAPSADATTVEPIKLTYTGGEMCMIPLKLTAIASQPNLEIVTWVFGQARAVPDLEFGEVFVDPVEIGTPANYLRAFGEAVDRQAGGRGFVTEYANSTARLSARGNETLAALLENHAYVTRLRTFIDPFEMTADPVFTEDPTGVEVSNVIVLPATGTLSSGLMFAVMGIVGWMKARRRS